MKALILTLAAAVAVSAQAPAEPPLLIQLVRKPGLAREPLRSYASAKAAVHVIGMTAMTGPVESWYLELHDSFGSIEDLDRALNTAGRGGEADPAEVQAPSRCIIAIRRLRQSHQPDQAVKLLPMARYYQISWSRTAPGRDAKFAVPALAYEVIAGDTPGLYLFVTPLTTLRTIDENMARALPPEFVAAATQGEIGHEHTLLRTEPRLSYVSTEFAAGDPDFWKGQK